MKESWIKDTFMKSNNKWIPIEELPEKEGPYLVILTYTGDLPLVSKQEIDYLYWYRNRWEDNCDHLEVNDKYWKVSHWMPLPDKPKD